MPTYLAPGVYVEEHNTGARPIVGVSTSTAAFVGVTERGPVGQAVLITGFAQFVKKFGGPIYVAPGTLAVRGKNGVRIFTKADWKDIKVEKDGQIVDPDQLMKTLTKAGGK